MICFGCEQFSRVNQEAVAKLNGNPKAVDFNDRVKLQLNSPGYNTYQFSFRGRVQSCAARIACRSQFCMYLFSHLKRPEVVPSGILGP